MHGYFNLLLPAIILLCLVLKIWARRSSRGGTLAPWPLCSESSKITCVLIAFQYFQVKKEHVIGSYEIKTFLGADEDSVLEVLERYQGQLWNPVFDHGRYWYLNTVASELLKPNFQECEQLVTSWLVAQELDAA